MLAKRFSWSAVRSIPRLLLIRCQSSEFVAPERPVLKSKDYLTKRLAVEGREDPEIFSSEYIPRQVLPKWHRNELKYRLERMDCLRRRQVIDIPEFYSGSIVKVTYADSFATGKLTSFIGRVLYRDGFALDCHFCLRNIIDGEGMEMIFQLYSPLTKKIEVIRLEKWIDTDLRYLRDAEDSICTISLDMTPEAIVPTFEELPVFKGKVKMKLKRRWEFQYHKSWPRPQNAYLKEHLIEEELIMFERYIGKYSWRHYDICRHHNFIDEKKEVMEEMKLNKLRIKRGKTNK